MKQTGANILLVYVPSSRLRIQSMEIIVSWIGNGRGKQLCEVRKWPIFLIRRSTLNQRFVCSSQNFDRGRMSCVSKRTRWHQVFMFYTLEKNCRRCCLLSFAQCLTDSFDSLKPPIQRRESHEIFKFLVFNSLTLTLPVKQITPVFLNKFIREFSYNFRFTLETNCLKIMKGLKPFDKSMSPE